MDAAASLARACVSALLINEGEEVQRLVDSVGAYV
jgi:hypothetical protein